MTTRAQEIQAIAEKLNQAGVPPKFSPEISRLLTSVMKTLAKGKPVTGAEVDEIIAELDMDHDKAEQFLRSVCERDADDNIIGIVGLSLNESWAHRFQVKDASMRTWCAWDTLFIPLLIDETAAIESESPISDETVRVTVSPEGVKEVIPATAVVSVVVLDPDNGQADSVEEIWSQFCHQVYFFTSREEAEKWAADRHHIEVLTVKEAFELGRHAWSSVLEAA